MYQFVYIVVCSLLTGKKIFINLFYSIINFFISFLVTAMIEFSKLFIKDQKVDYLFFIVWILLVLPTGLMIGILSTYIQQITESSLLNV